MKPSAKHLCAACLIAVVVGGGPQVIIAAENAVMAQDLVNVRSSGKATARWSRQADAYVLQVVLEEPKIMPRAVTSAGRERSQPQQATAQATAEETWREEMRRAGNWNFVEDGPADLYIHGTGANLRGVDPWFGCNRPLTEIDGRQGVQQQSYVSKIKERIGIWLLKVDGTQILPTDDNCLSDRISYRFPAVVGEQAVAAAIRIDDKYYIEKLQPLEPKPSAR